MDSSNLDPALGWISGCQVVSMNYQTDDLPMSYNQALFLLNSNIGYVLKPDWVIKGEEPQLGKIFALTVEILSGGGFPSQRFDIIDPYINVTIAGFKSDVSEANTKVITDNGHDPTFLETFQFKLRAPEVDFITFALYDKDTFGSDYVGRKTFPVSAIRKGYRAVGFDGQNWKPIAEAFLVCRFSFSWVDA